MGAGSWGSPGVPLLPFPPGGPGSYSSPSQTAQPARKALPCQQRPQPWLPAGWAGAVPQPGGWAGCAGLASDPRPCSAPAQEGSLKFSSAAPRPPAPALNPACALRSPAAGSPGYVSCPCAGGSRPWGQGSPRAVCGAGAHPAAMHGPPRTASTHPHLDRLSCSPLWPCCPPCCAPHSWPAPAMPGLFPSSTKLGCPHALSQMSNQGCPARREGSAPWLVTWPHTPLNTASPPALASPQMSLPALTAVPCRHREGWAAPRARQAPTHPPAPPNVPVPAPVVPNQSVCPSQPCPSRQDSSSVPWGWAPRQALCWGHGLPAPCSAVHPQRLPRASTTEPQSGTGARGQCPL